MLVIFAPVFILILIIYYNKYYNYFIINKNNELIKMQKINGRGYNYGRV